MVDKFVRKGLVIGIIFLFIVMSVIPSTSTLVKKSSTMSYDGKTLYVGGSGPGNYSTIQDAIDNATDGDMVFVYNGMYDLDDWIIIDKSIGLIGENKFNTIINGVGIYINVSNVNISGFTVQNGFGFIILTSNFDTPGNNNIYDNFITNNDTK